MKDKLNFKSDVKFSNNISEIISISLDCDYSYDESFKGSFILEGEYRSYEKSLNKEKFKYTLPFSIDMDERIDKDTINIDIKDFKYNVNADTLSLSIDYEFNYDVISLEEKQELIDYIDEHELKDEDKRYEEEVEETHEIEENDVSFEEEFITYQIITATNEDTINSICTKYNITEEMLRSINEISTITNGLKLIIPININA